MVTMVMIQIVHNIGTQKQQRGAGLLQFLYKLKYIYVHAVLTYR